MKPAKRPTDCKKNKHYFDSYIWGAAIVETSLRQMILLWEQRNKNVHGSSDNEVETLRKQKLVEKAKELQLLQDDTRPSDSFLFPINFKQFISSSTSEQIASWICTSQRAIKNSVKKWKEHKDSGVRSVIGWLTATDNQQTNDNNSNIFRNLRTSFRKRMLDGRQKEQRRRPPSNESNQPDISSYLTLLQN